MTHLVSGLSELEPRIYIKLSKTSRRRRLPAGGDSFFPFAVCSLFGSAARLGPPNAG